MGVIFSLSGCKAVGKTTLINGLKKFFPEMIIREGFRPVDLHFNLNEENEYYKNENFYIYREIDEYYRFRKSDKPVLLLRGPEDLEFYALNYPKIMGNNWDVEKGLKKELEDLRKCRSDYILYLDADLSTIMSRKNNDITKPRKNMDRWLNDWQPYLERYTKSINYTTVLNTDQLSSEEVLEWTTKWIIIKLQEQGLHLM